MTPRVIPSANYGAFWPGGIGYISLTLPAGLESPLLYFKVSADGRVVGKAQSGNATPYWTGSRWLSLGTCTGVNVAAFHPTSGEVYVSDAAGVRVHDRAGLFVRLIPGYIGSQGIRWVNADGSVVSGDETYGVTGLLGEHFRVGELRIGQGLKGGLDVVDGDGAVRHVCDGRVDFLQVNAVGDAVACYWTDFRDGYLLQTSLSALSALPLLTTSAPPIVNTPPPIVNTEPLVSIPNQLDVVQRVRAGYPTPLADKHPAFLIALAKALGAKLFRKDGGSHVTLPNGVNVSQDIVIVPGPDGPWWVDVLGDAEGAAVPAWDAHPNAGGEFVDVSGLGVPAPPAPPAPDAPPQQPPAPSAELSAVLARLDLMDARNEAQFAIQRAAAADTMQTLLRIAESLDALRTAKQLPVVFPNYSGTARLGTLMRFTMEPQK